jgi:plastocyanin
MPGVLQGMPRHRRALIVAATLLATIAVLRVAPAHAATVNVTVADNVFQPASVTIAAGDTVVWTQPGSRVHNVTADDGSFSSGNLAAGGTFSRVFASAGTFRYYCSIHGAPGGIGMSGVVVVQAAQVTTTTAAPTTTTTTAAPTTTTTAAAAASPPTTAAAQVLSASATAGDSTTAAAPAAQPALASTGLITLPLVAIALALLVTGAVLVRRTTALAGRTDSGDRGSPGG